MLEPEAVLAFGVGKSLMAPAAMEGRMGSPQLSASTGHAGLTLARGGIKVGVTIAGIAGTAARSVARAAAETAGSFIDLITEARSELEQGDGSREPVPAGSAAGATTQLAIA